MIEELRYEEMIGYGCVVVATAEINDKEKREQYTKSKSFALTSRMMNPDNIIMDVITSKKRARPQLKEIIDTFSRSGRKNPCGTIVMQNISELGTTPPEIFANYSKLNDADIGIIIFDSEFLSTADYGCNYCKDEKQRTEIIQELKDTIPDDFKTKRGRKQREIVITDDFKLIYWWYETYRLYEKNTYKNKLIMLNKISFKEYCRAYEASPEYEIDEQEQARHYDLISLPKRFGTIPENFDQLFQLHTAGEDLYSACEKLGIPPMTEITFRRYITKIETGKKGMAQATFQNVDLELNDSIALM